MTVTDARKMRRMFYSLTNPTEEDRFVYTEALEFLIHETKDPDYMVELGSMYYEQKRFDLALKYYEMAAEYDNRYAISNLGYIWYYGRTGKQDFEKAFFFEEDAHEAEAVMEDGGIVIRFDETWFRTIDDFFQKAELDGELLTTRYGELYDFKVVREWN